VQLDEPLKQLGEFHIPVKLHREVSAHIKVTVSAEAGAEA
jgi:large subunit ribosomal protein L9